VARTLVDIDDKLLEAAMEVSGSATKRGTITVALQDMVRRARLREHMDSLDHAALADLDDPAVVRSAQR
jgi:Arc/MetJ family transcription regulator